MTRPYKRGVDVTKLVSWLLAMLITMVAFPATALTIAAIEIGSKGVKARVIELDENYSSQDQGLIYSVVYQRNENPGITDGADSNMLAKEGIKRGAAAVLELINEMKKKYDPVHLSIVASTSFDRYRNRTVLEDEIRDVTGRQIHFITEDDETYYALKTSVPRKFAQRSIIIDIGSGNTKIGYRSEFSTNQKKFEAVRIEYGSGNVHDRSVARGGDFESAIRDVIKDEVRPSLQKALEGHAPVFSSRRIIFVEGGAAWVVSTFAKPQDVNLHYTELRVSDVLLARSRLQSTAESGFAHSGKS